ncbi:MAG TPA: ATP-binding protein, partial [Methylophilaceae bacterium]|nr:ATP-binding protein [Methylophilaceae bacterium]
EAFLLGQAIYNVLDNALDFSPENSHIQIHISQQQHQAHIRIQDQGTGIPDYALTKIFDKFYSLPRPQNTANAGQKSTGLGLNFVQEVVKLHGGSITLQNNSNGGAIATMTFPM